MYTFGHTMLVLLGASRRKRSQTCEEGGHTSECPFGIY